MQRTTIILAYSFILVTTAFTNCLAQQYPFVHYTPRDGLISNNIRSIYQDSKGRFYFASINGLSVYDGARFTNYNSKNGLESDIVNCVMEMGEDSIWIVTNEGKVKSLVKGKLKETNFTEPPPLIDNLVRDEKGTLYAASEKGLYRFQQNKFARLPFIDKKGRDISTYIATIYPAGNYLLIIRDNSLVATEEEKHRLYLYDINAGKIIDDSGKEIIYHVAVAPDGRTWAGTNNGILSIDTKELRKGKIIFQDLPEPFGKLKNSKTAFLSFDREGNCWLSDKASALQKITPQGHPISYTIASGLKSMDISNVYQDKEGITWIATHSAGLEKLVHGNFSIIGNAFGISEINSISYDPFATQLFLYSPHHAKLIQIGENGHQQTYHVKEPEKFQILLHTPKGFFGNSGKGIYKLTASGNELYPELIFEPGNDEMFGSSLIDRNGNFIICGKNYLTAVINGNIIYRKKISYFADHAALDTMGRIWVANRAGELTMYQPLANDPSHYLEKEVVISKKLPGVLPRSITVDKNNNIWIGSRDDGIFVFRLKNGELQRQFHLNHATGLSDNFINVLACDSSNNIWACSTSGLDKISIKNGIPVIENLTKENNIYQRVSNVVIDKTNNAWALLHNNLIKITSENKRPLGYSPTLIVSMIKAGQDTIENSSSTVLSHKQNNLSFYFAATSFLDEKQVLYSYQLQGSSNNYWSEPSNNSSVSFVDLHPGDYVLNVKAIFQASRYTEKLIQYKFSISPPWWQTVLFRLIAATFIIGFLIVVLRYYYRRKLIAQRRALEKQQAIEKERTRIATDMHDDLGAGLSRIKFLSQALSHKQTHDETVKNTLEKITGYSDEMSEKMGEIVWALNEKNDTLADLVAYTRSYAVEYLADNNIQCEAHTPMNLPASFITGEMRRNVFLTVKECLHNIVKHAQASKVYFSVELNGAIEILIHDNGKGIDFNNRRINSNGLQNIQKRMKEIKGKADFFNEKGTKVLLRFPLNL